MEIIGIHPHDLTTKLRSLILKGFLDSDGQSRGTKQAIEYAKSKGKRVDVIRIEDTI